MYHLQQINTYPTTLGKAIKKGVPNAESSRSVHQRCKQPAHTGYSRQGREHF